MLNSFLQKILNAFFIFNKENKLEKFLRKKYRNISKVGEFYVVKTSAGSAYIKDTGKYIVVNISGKENKCLSPTEIPDILACYLEDPHAEQKSLNEIIDNLFKLKKVELDTGNRLIDKELVYFNKLGEEILRECFKG
jgi:hypothetical protein